MPLGWNEIRDRALAFSREWKDATSEQSEAQSFWNDFFKVFGIERRRVAIFEKQVELSRAGRHYAIFTVGYVPYFSLYPGMRIPVPLEVVEHHGDSPAEQVCREILSLTKVNWNSCSFASGEPITIQFARTVGRILTEVPRGGAIQTKYKYYM